MLNINQYLNFNYTLVFFFILFPFLMITGPFLPDLFSSILSLFFLYLLFLKKINLEINKKFFLIFFIFFLILIFSSLINEINFKSLKSSFFYFRHFIFLLMFIYIINFFPHLYKFLFYSLTLIFIILIIDGYSEYFYSTGVLSNSIKESGRISSFFGDEYILGSYVSKFFLIYFYLFYKLNFQKKNLSLITYTILILSYFLVFMTAERSSFFLLNFDIILLLLFFFNFKNLIIYCLFITLTLFGLSKDDGLKHRYVDLTKNTFTYIKNQNYYDEITFNLKTSSEIIKKNIFFGAGPRNYYLECNNFWYKKNIKLKNSCTSHPHNYHLQLIAEVGIAGYLFIILFFFYLIWKLIKIRFQSFSILRKDKSYVILIISLITILWPLTTSGNFFNNWLSYFNFFVLSLFFAENQLFTKFKNHE